jgi:hypothetical protein
MQLAVERQLRVAEIANFKLQIANCTLHFCELHVAICTLQLVVDCQLHFAEIADYKLQIAYTIAAQYIAGRHWH